MNRTSKLERLARTAFRIYILALVVWSACLSCLYLAYLPSSLPLGAEGATYRIEDSLSKISRWRWIPDVLMCFFAAPAAAVQTAALIGPSKAIHLAIKVIRMGTPLVLALLLTAAIALYRIIGLVKNEGQRDLAEALDYTYLVCTASLTGLSPAIGAVFGAFAINKLGAAIREADKVT